MKQKLKTILKGLSASVFVLTFALLLTFCSKEGKDETISQSHTEEQQSAVLSNSKSSAKVTTFGFDTCSYPYSGTSLGNDREDWKQQLRQLSTQPYSDTKYFFETGFRKGETDEFNSYYNIRGRVENLSNVPVVVRMVYVLDVWGWSDEYRVMDGCHVIQPGEGKTLMTPDSTTTNLIPEYTVRVRFEIIVPPQSYGSQKSVKLKVGLCRARNRHWGNCLF